MTRAYNITKERVRERSFVSYLWADLPSEDMATREFHRTIAILPGPREHRSVRPLMQMIANDFLAFGGTRTAAPTKSLWLTDEQGVEHLHRPFLRGVDADTPAGNKVAESKRQGAHLDHT